MKIILVLLLGVVVMVGGALSTHPDFLARFSRRSNVPSISMTETPGGSVLGTENSGAENALESIAQAVSSAAQSVISAIPLDKENPKNVEQIINEIKQKSAAIPEEAFSRARYEYCKQVIVDYEAR